MKGEDEPTNGRHAAAEDDRRWTAAQWAALAELVKDHSKLVIVQECLRNEVEDTASLRAHIAELEAAREGKPDE